MITCAVIAVVIFVIIVAVAVSGTRSNQQNVIQTPPVVTIEPLQGGGSTSSQFSSPISESNFFRIQEMRLPPTSDLGMITTTNLENPIYIPATIKIYHNQRQCRICKKPINWSSRESGWVRCLSTNLLVHGHCYDFTKRQHTSERNWCTICSGPCRSNQPMRIEGM